MQYTSFYYCSEQVFASNPPEPVEQQPWLIVFCSYLTTFGLELEALLREIQMSNPILKGLDLPGTKRILVPSAV